MEANEKMVSLHVLIPANLKEELQRQADSEERPLSNYVRLLLQTVTEKRKMTDDKRQRH